MTIKTKVLLLVTGLMLLPVLSVAQTDPFGVPDTIYADIAKIDDFNWSITISCFNDEDVIGIAVPFKMSAGLNKIVADSAIYTGGRVTQANWAYPGFRPDTAIQCVTLGMIANLGPTENKLEPGSGRLVTVFVSSLEEKKIENLTIDTTTTHPSNYLQMIVDRVQGDPPDTTALEFDERLIVPAWVVRQSEYMEPK